MQCNVLLTGGTGFVGSELLRELNSLSWINLIAAVRSFGGKNQHVSFEVGAIDGETDYSLGISDIDVVIHVAGRAHVVNDRVEDPLSEFRRVNRDGTLNLARQAAAAGVRRFIFISSIGVNGNVSTKPFTASDCPGPVEPYALSKWEAEQGLWEVQRKTGMEVVIIRPPLIYGPGAPGNFARLVLCIEKGIPLPLGAINNKRSLVSVENLISLIVRCIDHPSAANQVFLAGDGQAVSTTELLKMISKAKGRSARLLPIPERILRLCAFLLGKQVVMQRLLGSLQVDIGATCRVLEWSPPFTMDEGLKRCFDRKA